MTLQQESAAEPAEELVRLEKELAAQKALAQGLEKKEKATEQELDALRDKLIEASNELQKKANEQEELESKLASLEKESVVRAGVLGESRRRLAVLTRLLLQFSREPSEMFVMREQSPQDHIHRTIMLRSMLPRLKEETVSLARDLDQYEVLQGKTEAQKRLVVAAQQNLSWQKNKLDQLINVRQGTLEKTAQEKETLARQLDTLTAEAKDLRQLMEKVTQSSWSKTVGKASPARSLRMKTGVKMPVVGKLVRKFGDKDEFGVVSEGLTLAAAAGSPVVAPQAGRVMFAGAFRGYGKAVVLQHEGGYHSFLSGFSRIDAEVGQTVDGGEPLGVLPPKGEGKSEIYFEWRRGSDPVNPGS